MESERTWCALHPGLANKNLLLASFHVFSLFTGLMQKSMTTLEAMCWRRQSPKMEGGWVSESLLDGKLPTDEGTPILDFTRARNNLCLIFSTSVCLFICLFVSYKQMKGWKKMRERWQGWSSAPPIYSGWLPFQCSTSKPQLLAPWGQCERRTLVLFGHNSGSIC